MLPSDDPLFNLQAALKKLHAVHRNLARAKCLYLFDDLVAFKERVADALNSALKRLEKGES